MFFFELIGQRGCGDLRIELSFSSGGTDASKINHLEEKWDRTLFPEDMMLIGNSVLSQGIWFFPGSLSDFTRQGCESVFAVHISAAF
jgi:hypothetical protein